MDPCLKVFPRQHSQSDDIQKPNWNQIYESGLWKDLGENNDHNNNNNQINNKLRLEFFLFDLINKTPQTVSELYNIYEIISSLLCKLDIKTRYAIVNSQYLYVTKRRSTGIYTPQFTGTYVNIIHLITKYYIHYGQQENNQLQEIWKLIINILLKNGLNPMLLMQQIVVRNANSHILFAGYQNSKIILSYLAYQKDIKNLKIFTDLLYILSQFDGDKYHLVTEYITHPPILTISFKDNLGSINGCNDIDGKCYIFGDAFKSMNDGFISPKYLKQILRYCPQSPLIAFISLQKYSNENNMIYAHTKFMDKCRIKVNTKNKQFIHTMASYIDFQFDQMIEMQADKRLIYLYLFYKYYKYYKNQLLNQLETVYDDNVLPFDILQMILNQYCFYDISYLYDDQELKENDNYINNHKSLQPDADGIDHNKWFYIFFYSLDSFSTEWQQWIYQHLLCNLCKTKIKDIKQLMEKHIWYRSFVVKSYKNNDLTMWILNLNENKVQHTKLYGLIKDNANKSIDNLRIIIEKFVTKEFNPRIWKDIWSGIIIHSQYTLNNDIINEIFIKMVQHFSIDFNEINKHLMESLICIIDRWPLYFNNNNKHPLRYINCCTFLKFMSSHPKAIIIFQDLLFEIIKKGKSEFLQLLIECEFINYEKCKEKGLIDKIWIIINQQKQNGINNNNQRQRNQNEIIREKMLNQTSSIFQEWVDKFEGNDKSDQGMQNGLGWNFQF